MIKACHYRTKEDARIGLIIPNTGVINFNPYAAFTLKHDREVVEEACAVAEAFFGDSEENPLFYLHEIALSGEDSRLVKDILVAAQSKKPLEEYEPLIAQLEGSVKSLVLE